MGLFSKAVRGAAGRGAFDSSPEARHAFGTSMSTRGAQQRYESWAGRQKRQAPVRASRRITEQRKKGLAL